MPKKINCIIVDDEPVAREILESYIKKLDDIKLVKSCKNVMEAFKVINSERVDLILLDINMPEVSGLSLAKAIDKKAKVIFTTAYREYAFDGFELQAVDYLLKPISFERFLKAINKFFDLAAYKTKHVGTDQSKHEFIFVRSERKMVKINFDEILYVESLSDYVKIHTKDKIIVTRETITNLEAKLATTQFLRIHRSFIVTIRYIESYTNEFVEIHQKALPVSRSYREAVLQKLKTV